MLQRCTV